MDYTTKTPDQWISGAVKSHPGHPACHLDQPVSEELGPAPDPVDLPDCRLGDQPVRSLRTDVREGAPDISRHGFWVA